MQYGIRKWQRSDAADLSKALSDRAVLDNLRDGIPFPYTEQHALEYIEAMLDADEKDTFAFAVTENDRAIGSIGAFRQQNIHYRTAELGYYLAQPYWGKGIMTKAVSLLCQHIFESTDILRIFAEPFDYNTGSIRVLEKAGFSFEGTMRQNAFKNGRVLDMRLYSLTKDDWALKVKPLPRKTPGQ